MEIAFPRRRMLYILWIILVMAAGLLWRSGFFSLPWFFDKYGGDALWALLVFFLFGFLFRHASILQLVLAALCFSWVVEFSQLYHAPWIDHLRVARLGGLILGSVFNIPDLLAYIVGIAMGAIAEYFCLARMHRLFYGKYRK
jgi:hypothetical protein